MRKIITLIIIVFCFSCQKKRNENICFELEKKFDSLLKLNNSYNSSPFYKFHEIYKNEKQSLADTILIPKYQSIISADEVVDLYIDVRINTISQLKIKKEILDSFIGMHNLKPKYSEYDRYITSIKITNDSCFIFKGKKLKSSGKIKLIYSRNDLTPGTFTLDNYLIKLIKPNIVLLRDKECLHCSPLEFY